MDIFFFERMRVVSGERGRVIYRLRLPKLVTESECDFNSFYNSLESAYSAAADRVAKSVAGDVRFTVSFTVESSISKAWRLKLRGLKKAKAHDTAQAMIKRVATVKSADGERVYSSFDIYDLALGIFIK